MSATTRRAKKEAYDQVKSEKEYVDLEKKAIKEAFKEL
jgi:hypothetical protein